MVIDGFDEILNTLYIAKRLYDMGRYEVAETNFFDTVDYDVYYENMYGLIENIFESYYCQYYERHGMEIHVLSDPVIVDFCLLAGEYGKWAESVYPGGKTGNREALKFLILPGLEVHGAYGTETPVPQQDRHIYLSG